MTPVRLEDPLATRSRARGDERDAVAQRIEDVFELVTQMIADSTTGSTLDPRTIALVRLAALLAAQAPPLAYDIALDGLGDVVLSEADVNGVVAAVAPIVGTARIIGAREVVGLSLSRLHARAATNRQSTNGGSRDGARC